MQRNYEAKTSPRKGVVMRAFVAASLIAVMLALFVIAATVEPESQHAEAAVQTGLVVEAECPCAGVSCSAHASLMAHYEEVTMSKTCVLKLPKVVGSKSALLDSTMSLIAATIRHHGLRPGTVLKLPHYSAGLPMNDTGSRSKVEVCNVGVRA